MIGLLARETIGLMRAYRCQHEWVRLNDQEEQCTRCTIIATQDGKKTLAVAAARFRGRPVEQGGE